MCTRKKFLKNSQEFGSLIHHRRSGFKKNTDKVWLSESLGKLKGVGQLAIAKMNELRIHTIADLQLYVSHHSKVPIRGFDQIYAMDLQALPGNPPSSFKDHRKAKNPYHSRYGEGWVDKLKSSTEMSKFCCITTRRYIRSV